jgi:poly(3-hydroxybutyrate) depolymerase
MTGKTIAWSVSALVVLGSALAGCSSSTTLVDQTVEASQFGPQIVGTMGADAGTVAMAPPASLPVVRSAGCDMALSKTRPNQLLGTYTPYTMHVTGATLDPSFSVAPHDRGYFVWVPKDYDPSKAYRITFLFMGCGNRTAADTATYKLMGKDPESIYVAMDMPPAGFPPAGKDCYDNTVGKQSVEWEAMGLVASQVQKDFCVDENRLFVSGYSSGAWVSNMFGCYFAGKDPNRQFGPDVSVRGQASVTGGPVLPDVSCSGKVAALWIHDSDDHENIIGGNSMTSLPRVLAANGCMGGVSGATVPWGTSVAELMTECKQYTSCPAQYPVIFCTTSGRGHSAQDVLALPSFIEFQNMMNAK